MQFKLRLLDLRVLQESTGFDKSEIRVVISIYL